TRTSQVHQDCASAGPRQRRTPDPTAAARRRQQTARGFQSPERQSPAPARPGPSGEPPGQVPRPPPANHSQAWPAGRSARPAGAGVATVVPGSVADLGAACHRGRAIACSPGRNPEMADAAVQHPDLTEPVTVQPVEGSDRPASVYLAPTLDGLYTPYALRTPADEGSFPFVFLAYGNGGGGIPWLRR